MMDSGTREQVALEVKMVVRGVSSLYSLDDWSWDTAAHFSNDPP